MLNRSVLWDSSAILAFLDADDANYVAASRIFDALASQRRPGVLTNYTEVEAHSLLLRKLGRGPARDWLLHSGLTVLRATASEESDAKALLISHDDQDWSLCDAISFAVARRREIKLTFSFDHHFRQFPSWRVLD